MGIESGDQDMMSEAKVVTGLKDKAGYILLSVILLALALFDRLRHQLDMHPDCAMYLQCGQMLLSGKIPYVDFYDVNPPLIMYLSVIPAGLAAWLRQDVMLSFWLFIWCLTIISTIWSASIFWRAADAQQWKYLGPLLVAIALLPLTVKDIGQREHIFVMFYLPFFCLRWWRWRGGRPPGIEASLLGVLTGIGIALKPFLLLVVILPELYWLAKSKNAGNLLCPETVAVVAVGLLYLGHFLWLPAEMRHNFFQFLLPLVNGGYDYMNSAFPPPLPLNKRMILLLLVLPIAWLCRRRCDLMVPLLMWVAGGYLAMCMQQKGFVYHAIPMFSAVILLAGLILGVLSEHKKLLIRLVAYLLALILTLGLIGKEIWVMPANPYLSPNGAGGGDFADVIAKYSHAGDAIFFATVPVQDPYAVLVQMNRRPACRYLWLFPIPCYEQMKAKSSSWRQISKIDKQEKQVAAQIVADAAAGRPKLIFVWKGTFTVNDAPKSPISLYRILQEAGLDKLLVEQYDFLLRRGDTEVYKLKASKRRQACS
jgi:hypothetical protein